MLYESFHCLPMKNQSISAVAMLWFHMRRLTFPARSGKCYDFSDTLVWSLVVIPFVRPCQIRLKWDYS